MSKKLDSLRRRILEGQDTKLFKVMLEDTPAFNYDVMNGLATKHLKAAKDTMDQIIRCAEEQFPEGLVFHNSSRCTPLEEYNVTTKVRGTNEYVFDLAKSMVTLHKYEFSYKGEPLGPYYHWLPFCKDGGLWVVNDKTFAISPVLADYGFSVGQRDIFIHMPRGRATFYQTTHAIRENGVPVEYKIPWSILHNKAAKPGRVTPDLKSSTIKLGSVHPTLVHYLLARYGFYATFKQFLNVDVTVTTSQALDASPPGDAYMVVQSMRVKPVYLKTKAVLYRRQATDLAFVVRKEEYTPLLSSMLTQAMYIIDHFPDEIAEDTIDDPWQWQVFMGYILWGDTQSQGKLVEQVVNHLKSLDGYIDPIARSDLLKEGVDVRNIYELFVYIVQNMRRLLNERSGSVSSMYNKEFMVLRYVLRDLNDRMFKMLFKLNVNNRKEHTRDSVDKILREAFLPEKILRIPGSKEHSEISSVASPSDNKFFKITSVILRQADTASKGRGKESRPMDATSHLDVSFSEVGGYNVLSKKVPVGNNRVNPTVLIDENGRVVRKEKFRELTDSVQEKIRR
ncbi:hypothetical protein ACLPJK_25760 [Pseudomonas aeruginosa]|uniref:hypothetical protein n=1 Tax=Pseudomonas aeruginosa TaxID=287 RepID=UPI003D26F6AB